MNKEIIDNEIEFPDDIISFLKIKYPKGYTDQEKSVLKQIECLAEEKRELKEILGKKRDQEKIKIIPINVAACEEAKEKAIKLVQEGTLNLSSRTKLLDIDDSIFGDSDQLNIDSNTKSKVRHRSGNKKSDGNPQSKQNASQKISFVSAGYAFADSQADKTDDSTESGTRRSLSQPSTIEFGGLKRLRHISDSSSNSEDEERKSNLNNNISHLQKSENLRFCGHNLSIEFVRKIVEPYGNIVFIELESRTDGKTPNVILTMDNVDIAVKVLNGLDSKYLEGRVISVHFRRDTGAFGGRRRRRRGRDQFRSRDRFSFQRNTSFQSSSETDKTLPSHFYSSGTDLDDTVKRKPNWSMHDDLVQNGETVAKIIRREESPKGELDRGLVVYDGFPVADEDEVQEVVVVRRDEEVEEGEDNGL